MRSSNSADIVRNGYNQVAELYVEARDQWQSNPHLDRMLDRLPPDSQILDVGCGAGVPVASYLAERGHRVVGVDVSPRQIELARINVPEGVFEVRDMCDFKSGEFQVDAVVSFYAIFHTPRESHGDTLRKLASLVPRGGLLLVTMGAGEWEGEEAFFGVPMWWSHFGAEKNRELVAEAGFRIVHDEIDHSGDERHQVILGVREQRCR